VRRYDGYVVQSTGDGIFAVFGAPVAREDHPQRSLYGAMRMQDEIRRYSARLRAEGRPPIQIRPERTPAKWWCEPSQPEPATPNTRRLAHHKSCIPPAESRQCRLHGHKRQHAHISRGLLCAEAARAGAGEGDQRAHQRA
jgi:hypothetical protein